MKFVFAILFFVSLSAQADVITCRFTEPFLTTTYNMEKHTFTVFDNAEKKLVSKTRRVAFVVKGPGQFEIVTRKGQVLQKLNLNFQGSDGMSDQVYPYDVQWLTAEHLNNQMGGCESQVLKRKEE